MSQDPAPPLSEAGGLADWNVRELVAAASPMGPDTAGMPQFDDGEPHRD